jgi:hypothetical protein
MKKMVSTLTMTLCLASSLATELPQLGNKFGLNASNFVMKNEHYILPGLDDNQSYIKIIESLNPNNMLLRNDIGTLRSTGNGNGGDVLICSPGSSLGATVHLLDLYEANYVKNLPIDIGGDALSLDEKMDLIFSRVEKKSRVWANLLRDYYKEFYNEAVLVDEANLVNVDDSDHLAIPTNCVIKQIAIQKENPIDSSDPRYIINGTLWNLLSIDHQASLILHELIYRNLLHKKSSVLTRHFVGLIVSNHLETMSSLDFAKILSKNEFHMGMNLDSFDVYVQNHHSYSFEDPNVIELHSPAQKEGLIRIGQHEYKSAVYYNIFKAYQVSLADDEVAVHTLVFNKEFDIARVVINLNNTVINYRSGGASFFRIINEVATFKNGKIASFSQLEKGSDTSISTGKLSASVVKKVELYKEGMVSKVVVDCERSVTVELRYKGKLIDFKRSRNSTCNELTVDFDKDGSVNSYSVKN